jgi:hypothetical protein
MKLSSRACARFLSSISSPSPHLSILKNTWTSGAGALMRRRLVLVCGAHMPIPGKRPQQGALHASMQQFTAWQLTLGQPYASRSLSSVITTSTRPFRARYAICASASYGATMNSTPLCCRACSTSQKGTVAHQALRWLSPHADERLQEGPPTLHSRQHTHLLAQTRRMPSHRPCSLSDSCKRHRACAARTSMNPLATAGEMSTALW